VPAELGGGARIIVKFPDGFTLNKNGPTTVQGNAVAGLAGAAAAIATGQSAIVIRASDAATAPAGAAVLLTLTNVQNPGAGAAGGLTVEIEDAAGNPIATGTSDPVTISAASAPPAAPTPAGAPR
ncbi:MAG: hypothetical protein WC211_09140, partial [Dehalococcoidia bacterium]